MRYSELFNCSCVNDFEVFDVDELIFLESIKEFHKILPVKFFFSDDDKNPN